MIMPLSSEGFILVISVWIQVSQIVSALEKKKKTRILKCSVSSLTTELILSITLPSDLIQPCSLYLDCTRISMSVKLQV